MENEKECDQYLKVKDFRSFVLHAQVLQAELEKETAIKKSPKDVDKAVINKIDCLIKVIASDDYLGERRF